MWSGKAEVQTYGPRLACQAIVNAHQERRLRWAVIPKGCILGNSVNHIEMNQAILNRLSAAKGDLQKALEWMCDQLNQRDLDDWAKAWSANNNVNNYELEMLPLQLELRVVLKKSRNDEERCIFDSLNTMFYIKPSLVLIGICQLEDSKNGHSSKNWHYGTPRSGKSAVMEKVLSMLKEERERELSARNLSDTEIIGGICTEPILENGERLGYKVRNLVTGDEGEIAHKSIDSRLRVLGMASIQLNSSV